MAGEYRIGIVDPDSEIRTGRKLLLESSGRINVMLEMTSATEILEKFSDYLIDVLIVDQRLRGTSGIQVLQKLSSKKLTEAIDTRLLLTAPFQTDRLEYEALSAGASALVSQEAGSRALIDTVLSLGAKRRQYSLDSMKQLMTNLNAKTKPDHVLETQLANLQGRDASIVEAIVSGKSISEVATTFDVASYRVRKLLESVLAVLGLCTLEQLQLRYLNSGLAVQ
ncbi:MAG: response regulator [Microbacteriaceae bacterium]